MLPTLDPSLTNIPEVTTVSCGESLATGGDSNGYGTDGFVIDGFNSGATEIATIIQVEPGFEETQTESETETRDVLQAVTSESSRETDHEVNTVSCEDENSEVFQIQIENGELVESDLFGRFGARGDAFYEN